MTRPQIAREMANILKASGEGAPIIPRVTIERWILQLAPKKIRKRDPLKAERRATKKELWSITREIVRKRADGFCEYCPVLGRPPREGTQGCHIFPKGRYRRVEFDIDNVFWGCSDCHMNHWHGFNPDDKDARVAFARDRIGAARWNALNLRARANNGRVDLGLTRFHLIAEGKKYGLELGGIR